MTKEYPELNQNVPLGTGTYRKPELEQGIAAHIEKGPGAYCESGRKSGE